MSKFKVNAFVMRGVSTGETSRILTLFTDSKGKIQCAARGARKTASSKGGMLELFGKIEAEIYQKENADLGTLSSAENTKSYPSIIQDTLKFGTAAAICEIITKSTTEGESSLDLFGLLGSYFETLDRCPSESVQLLFWSTFLKTLTALGYQPILKACAICGKPNPGKAAYYDSASGGIICSNDLQDHHGKDKLCSASVKLLQAIAEAPIDHIPQLEANPKQLYEIEKFIMAFADYHTGLHRNLKSFKFLSQLKANGNRRNSG